MADRPGHGHIFKFAFFGYTPQKQSTPTHIASPDEACWKEQPFTKEFHQRLGVFFCADTSEQNDFAFAGAFALDGFGISGKGPEITRFVGLDRDSSEIPQV